MKRLLLVLPLVSAACAAPQARLAVAPSILSEEWSQPSLAAADAPSPATGWSAFGSDELAELIARARVQNTDIGVAAARIVQARGQLRAARAAGLPAASLVAGAAGLAGGGRGSATDLLHAGAEISWEVDLFGGLAAGKKAARARFAAASYDHGATSLLVESELARAYFEHAALAQRIELVDRALANARELERIIRVRAREGVATLVDTGLQSLEVRRIEAQRSELIEAHVQVRNALSVLVGEEAPRFAPAGARLESFAVPVHAVRQPAELLVRRPDVRAAEARIAAASGDVGQARAAFLPGLTLSGRTIVESVAGGSVQLVAGLGADLLAPIFDAGRLRGRLITARGVQQEAVELYRGVLLNALREAEDALTASHEAGRRQALLADTLEEARRTAALARRQYVEGAADLQTVLDAERSLLDVEQEHALATRDRLAASVRLVTAMGGWPEA